MKGVNTPACDERGKYPVLWRGMATGVNTAVFQGSGVNTLPMYFEGDGLDFPLDAEDIATAFNLVFRTRYLI